MPNTDKRIRSSGIQPQYFPRLHYFNRILNADIFLVRDEVQFVRDHKYPDGHRGPSYQAHTPIKTFEGTFLLSIPVKHSGFNPIFQTRISQHGDWIEKHLKSVFYSYKKALNFDLVYPELEMILGKKYDSLAELNISTILWALSRLIGHDFNKTIPGLSELNDSLNNQSDFRLNRLVLASESEFYKNNPDVSANEKIIGLNNEIGANEDYSGGTAMEAYMDKELFAKNGINVTTQNWQIPKYPQLFEHKQGFIPNLSIIDLLMNVEVSRAKKIIKG